MSNGLESTKYLITKTIHVKYENLALRVEKLLEMFKFSKSRPHSKVKVTSHTSWYSQKDLVTKNTHVKYQSFDTHSSKVLSKVKVFKKLVQLQGQGHKVLSQGIADFRVTAGTPFFSE